MSHLLAGGPPRDESGPGVAHVMNLVMGVAHVMNLVMGVPHVMILVAGVPPRNESGRARSPT